MTSHRQICMLDSASTPRQVAKNIFTSCEDGQASLLYTGISPILLGYFFDPVNVTHIDTESRRHAIIVVGVVVVVVTVVIDITEVRRAQQGREHDTTTRLKNDA